MWVTVKLDDGYFCTFTVLYLQLMKTIMNNVTQEGYVSINNELRWSLDNYVSDGERTNGVSGKFSNDGS